MDRAAVDGENINLTTDACLYLGDKCDSPAQLVAGRRPAFPIAELMTGRNGTVILRFVINEDGHPSDFLVESTTSKTFTEAALVAVRTWTFRPAQLKGKPIALTVRVPVVFNQ